MWTRQTSLCGILVGITFSLLVLLMPISTRSFVRPVDAAPFGTETVQVFRDDFDGNQLDPDLWQVYPNDGTVEVSSGYVTVSAPVAGSSFPYVHSRFNPIPLTGNFAVKVGIQYLTAAPNGDGFSVDDRLPANGSPGAWAWQPSVYTIWQDQSLGFLLWDYLGHVHYHVSAPHLSYHDIEFRWLDNTDQFYVDGQLVKEVARDNGTPRPLDLWFGNPVVAAAVDWTSFTLDYVEVNALDVPNPFFELPIDYPGRGSPTREEFLSAWQRCTTAFFDHNQPGEKGAAGDGFLWMFTGDKLPATDCTLFQNCYDGHEGYDFDDWSCYGSDVYPVAEGEIVVGETGQFDDGYGKRVVIQHGDTGYKTLYGHLSEILVWSGRVNADTCIGTIGESGCPGCGTHLHLSVYHDNQLVDPAGWEPTPWFDDPYVEQGGGMVSHRLWLFSPRRSTPVNDTLGMSLISSSGNITISIPSNAYGADYEIAVIELAPLHLSDRQRSAGHGFTLQARNLEGEPIDQLCQSVTVQVEFGASDINGIRLDTLSLYAWDTEANAWTPLPTIIELPTELRAGTDSPGLATVKTANLGYMALLGEPYFVHLPIAMRE